MHDPIAALEAEAEALRADRRAARRTPAAKEARNRGRAQRNRGYRAENRLRHRLKRFGFARVPGSGRWGGSWSGDLRRPAGRAIAVIEVKHRRADWPAIRGAMETARQRGEPWVLQGQHKQVRGWLQQGGGSDALILDSGERAEPLVVLRISTFERLLEEAGYRGEGDEER